MKQSTLIKRYAGSAAALLLTIACGAANAQAEQQASEYTAQTADGDMGTSPSSDQKDKSQQMLKMKPQSNGQGNSEGNSSESGAQ